LVLLWFEALGASTLVAAVEKLPDSITKLGERGVFTLLNLSSHISIISERDMPSNGISITIVDVQDEVTVW